MCVCTPLSPLCDVQLLSLQSQPAQCPPHGFRLWGHLQALQEADGSANTHGDPFMLLLLLVLQALLVALSF